MLVNPRELKGTSAPAHFDEQGRVVSAIA